MIATFLSEPDDALKCLICLSVARDPRQHEECGKLFCSECIEKYGRDKPCPNCKKTGGQFYKDHNSRRRISELQVKCDNVERKCEWVGTVGTLQEHVDTCQFALVPCPKECKDDNNQIKFFMSKDVQEHLEKDCLNRCYTCKYCGEEGTYAYIRDNHDKTCLKKILPCPIEGCSATMQCQHIKEHVTGKCEYIVVACKYETIGCKTELKRKDMAAHEEDDKLHLHMVIDMTVKLRQLLNVQQTLKNGEPIKFKLTDYQRHKNNNEAVVSPAHYIFPNGYHIALEVCVYGASAGQGTHVSVYAHFFEGRYDATLKWPFTGNITFTLLNQLENKNHYQKKLKIGEYSELFPGIGRGFPTFIPHSELGYDWVLNTQYLKDDTLYFRMLVEADNHKHWLE